MHEPPGAQSALLPHSLPTLFTIASGIGGASFQTLESGFAGSLPHATTIAALAAPTTTVMLSRRDKRIGPPSRTLQPKPRQREWLGSHALTRARPQGLA